MLFAWKRFGGYEVSSKGDKRFSAFNAIMLDGRSLECWYQGDCKGWCPGGTEWRLGKGKPPKELTPEAQDALIYPELYATTQGGLWEAYLTLWRRWCNDHVDLLADLREKILQHHRLMPSEDEVFYLCDRFATTPINQAHALAVILNEREGC